MKGIGKMRKRYHIRISAIAATVICIGMLLSGCDLFGIKSNRDSQTGSLRLCLAGMGGNSRSVVADPTQIAIDSYSIRLESHDGHATRSLSSSNETLTVEDLEFGTWDIKVDAIQGSSIVAHGEALDRVVSSGGPLSVTINLSMTQDGTGGFSLAVTFPASTGIDYVRGTLAKPDGTAVGSLLVPTIATAGDESSCVFAMSDVPSGAYILSMDFRRGGETGTPAGVFGEAVNVWDNVVSDRWVDPATGRLVAVRSFAEESYYSSNTSLSEFSISDQSGSIALSPLFSSSITAYSTICSQATIRLCARGSIQGQSIAYSCDSQATWVSLVSGVASAEIGLNTGSSTEITVRVTAPDGVTQAITSVTVDRTIPLLGLTASRSMLPLVVGTSGRIEVSAVPANATDQLVNWESLDSSIASVDQAGNVMGVSPGNTRIRALSYDGGYSCSISVNVYPAINVGNLPVRIAGSPGNFSARDGLGQLGQFADPKGLCALDGSLYIADAGSIRRYDIATGALTTLAGTCGFIGGTSTDGVGSNAIFHDTNAICTDGTYLYVTESNGNSLVRRVDPRTAEVVTFAGPLGIYLAGICTDGAYLYVAGYGTIEKIDIASREVTNLVGVASDRRIVDGDLSTARFQFLYGLTISGTTLYAQDGQCLRKVDLVTGTVTHFEPISGSSPPVRYLGVLANGGYIYLGQNLSPQLYGTTYHTATVERFSLSDVETGTNREIMAGYSGVVAPHQSADGSGSAARFNSIQGMAILGSKLYLIDSGNKILRSIDLSVWDELGIPCPVVTLAGAVGAQGSNDGSADLARFNMPAGICGNEECYYIADEENHIVRRISRTTGEVTTIAGAPGLWTGSGAKFGLPSGICMRDGQLYAIDANSIISVVDPISGAVTSVYSNAGNRGLCTDGKYIYSVGTQNVVYRNGCVIAGTSSAGAYLDGIGIDARFNNPTAVTTDGLYLYIADAGNKAIRKVDLLTQEVSTVKYLSSADTLTGIATDGVRIYVTDSSQGLFVISIGGGWTQCYLGSLYGVFLDSTGLLLTQNKSDSGQFTNILMRLK
jgi:sugar lactone lactonase YvrE